MATFGISNFALTYFGPDYPSSPAVAGVGSGGGAHGAILWLLDKGGGNPIQVEHAGAKVAWAINGAGGFSCFLKASTARALGAAGVNFIDTKWVRYSVPGLPDWGGVVTRPDWTPGWYELVCDGYLDGLGKDRRVPLYYGSDNATAGQLAQTAFRAMQSDDYVFLNWGGADETGDPITYQWRGGDFAIDVLPSLARASGQEYYVDANRNIYWRVRIGSNKTGTCLLVHPHEIVDYRYGGDAWTIQNDIHGQAADSRYERSANITARHTDSVKTLRAHEKSIRYPDVTNRETLRPLISRDLHKFAYPAETMTLTVADIQHGWGRFWVGDDIAISLPECNARREVRIMAMSVDVEAGTALLSVEILHEEDGW